MYPLKLWKFLKFGQKSTFLERLYLKTNKSHRIKYREEFVAQSLFYAPTKNKECFSCSFVLTFLTEKVDFFFNLFSIVVQFWAYNIFSKTLGTNVCYKFLLQIEFQIYNPNFRLLRKVVWPRHLFEKGQIFKKVNRYFILIQIFADTEKADTDTD